MATLATKPAARRNRRRLRDKGLQFSLRRHRLFAIGIFAPATLLVGLFIIFPVLNGVHLSFTNATPLRPDTAYVGIENFVFLFEDPEFWEVVGNTAYIVGVATLLATLCGYGLAVLGVTAGAVKG